MQEQPLLNNVKQKFAEARETCPGLSDDIYALTDYISLVANDTLNPSGLAICITLIIDDLQKGKNGFKKDEPLPEYLDAYREKLIPKIIYIPQVVDTIADEKFANEFREICNDVFRFNQTAIENENFQHSDNTSSENSNIEKNNTSNHAKR